MDESIFDVYTGVRTAQSRDFQCKLMERLLWIQPFWFPWFSTFTYSLSITFSFILPKMSHYSAIDGFQRFHRHVYSSFFHQSKNIHLISLENFSFRWYAFNLKSIHCLLRKTAFNFNFVKCLLRKNAFNLCSRLWKSRPKL